MTPHAEYNIATGATTGRRMCCDDPALLAANAAPGCAWVPATEHPAHVAVRLVTDDQGDAVPVLQPATPPKPDDTPAVRWVRGMGAEYWVPELTDAAHAANARLERTARLQACDWVVTKAQETGQPVPAPWREYRQALRDVSLQPGWPLQIDWPLQPE